MNKLIGVEVAYAKPDSQRIVALEVPEGSTVLEVIMLSGMLSIFPEIDLEKQKVGVFSEKRALEDEVLAGDRIEIYRDLVMDPKEARRIRAEMPPLFKGGKQKGG